MLPQHFELAEAVAAELNSLSDAGAFSTAFHAEATLFVLLKLEALQDLVVSVVPGPRSHDLETRGTDLREFEIDVAVQQKLGDTSLAGAQKPAVLQEEIEAALFSDGKRLALETPTHKWWICTGLSMIPGAEAGYVPAHLRDLGCYTGLSRFSFRRTA